MSTELTKPQKFKVLVSNESIQNRFKEVMKDKAPAFIANLSVMVANNPNIADCEHNSIIASALISASLDLPIDPNLGFAYIVPFKSKDVMKAQFQIGYKGFVQLAQRSGLYKTLHSGVVYEGQLTGYDLMSGEITLNYLAKKSDTVIGYFAYFKMLNGFEKCLYMTSEEINKHALKFSQTYKRGFGLWKDDFESMALKTVTKKLLTKWGALTVDIQTQKALTYDQAIINDNLEPEYSDNKIEEKAINDDQKEVIMGYINTLGMRPEREYNDIQANIDVMTYQEAIRAITYLGTLK